jgi:hypothetical protein
MKNLNINVDVNLNGAQLTLTPQQHNKVANFITDLLSKEDSVTPLPIKVTTKRYRKRKLGTHLWTDEEINFIVYNRDVAKHTFRTVNQLFYREFGIKVTTKALTSKYWSKKNKDAKEAIINTYAPEPERVQALPIN